MLLGNVMAAQFRIKCGYAQQSGGVDLSTCTDLTVLDHFGLSRDCLGQLRLAISSTLRYVRDGMKGAERV